MMPPPLPAPAPAPAPASRARSQDPPVMPDAHGAETHVDVGERDPEEAHPRPLLVPAIEAARAIVGRLLHRIPRQLVDEPAHDVPEGMAAERVTAQEDDVEGEHERAEPDAELLAPGAIVEPQRLPHVVAQEEQKD